MNVEPSEISPQRNKQHLLAWITISIMWLLIVLPSFTIKDDSSQYLPVQVRIQIAFAGRLLRIQDSGILSEKNSSELKLEDIPRKILEDCYREYPQDPKVVICAALERMHRKDYKRAMDILENRQNLAIKDNELYRSVLLTCAQHLDSKNIPDSTSLQSLLLQEHINRELDDYFRYIAFQQLQKRTRYPIKTNPHIVRAQFDVIFISTIIIVTFSNIVIVLGYVLWRAIKYISKRNTEELQICDVSSRNTASPQTNNLAEEKDISQTAHYSPLKIFFVYVIFQWLTVLLGGVIYLILGRGKLLSIFTTQITIYAILGLCIILALPKLRQKEACANKQAFPYPYTGDNLFGTIWNYFKVAFSLTADLFKIRWPNMRAIAWGYFGFACAMVSSALLSEITSLLFGKSPSSNNPFLTFISESQSFERVLLLSLVALFGPIFEELLYRGLLFKGINTCWPVPWAMICSSTLFGLAHGDNEGTLVLIGLGMVFAYVYHKSDNIWSSVIAHSLWNGMISFSLIYLITT